MSDRDPVPVHPLAVRAVGRMLAIPGFAFAGGMCVGAGGFGSSGAVAWALAGAVLVACALLLLVDAVGYVGRLSDAERRADEGRVEALATLRAEIARRSR